MPSKKQQSSAVQQDTAVAVNQTGSTPEEGRTMKNTPMSILDAVSIATNPGRIAKVEDNEYTPQNRVVLWSSVAKAQAVQITLDEQACTVRVQDVQLSQTGNKYDGGLPIQMENGRDDTWELADPSLARKTYGLLIDNHTVAGFNLITDGGVKDTMKYPAPKFNPDTGEFEQKQGREIPWSLKQKMLYLATQVAGGIYDLEPQYLMTVLDDYRGKAYVSPRWRQAMTRYYNTLYLKAKSEELEGEPTLVSPNRANPVIVDTDKMDAVAVSVISDLA